MKFKGNKLGTIIASTGVVIFSLAAAFSGSMAWFAMNRNATATGMQVTVRNMSKNISGVSFHKLKEIGNGNYKFYKSEIGSVSINGDTATYNISQEDANSIMGMYSSYDPHHPILIKLALTSTGTADIRAKRVANNEYTYMADPSYASIMEDEETISHPMSSAIEFYSYLNPVGGGLPTGSDYYYVPTSITTRSTSAAKAFPQLDNNGEYHQVFNEEVEIFNDSPIVSVEGTPTNCTELAIVVDYFPESLEYIYSYYMGNSKVNEGLTFFCDWGLYL